MTTKQKYIDPTKLHLLNQCAHGERLEKSCSKCDIKYAALQRKLAKEEREAQEAFERRRNRRERD